MLQPRRLATRMLAARVASERGVKLGDEVGYQIRLDRVCSAKTRIRFVTEGMLLRHMLADPKLSGISAILFDEFHERHLYGDITLARALDLQEQRRPDLRLVVMSATLDAGALQKYLAPCELLTSRGRTFPGARSSISTHRSAISPSGMPPPMNSNVSRVTTEGDVLIFMPGAYEISRTIQAVKSSRVGSRLRRAAAARRIARRQQDAAVARYETRKGDRLDERRRNLVSRSTVCAS